MRRLRITVVAACAVYLFTAGCTSTVGGSAIVGHGARGSHAVTAGGLPGLLLSLDETKKLLQFSDMATEESWNRPDTKGFFDPADCVGAVFSGMWGSYDGSGYQDFYQVRQTDVSPEAYYHWIDQGVATFQSSEAAESFVAKEVESWRRCTGRQLTYAFPEPDDWGLPYRIGKAVVSGCVTMINDTVDGDRRYDDVRVLAAKANVAVDLQFTGFEVSDEPVTAVRTILDRIPSQGHDCVFWG